MTYAQTEELKELTRRFRIDILKMLNRAGSGHPGGSLSAIDIIATLYLRILRHDPRHPTDPLRDRFVLSKGNGCPALYVVLAHLGYFPEEHLDHLRELGQPLQGHPDMRSTPGVEFSTGSLGNGLGAAVGMALAARLDHRPSRVYVLCSDAECQEGMVWEAAMSAAHHRLDNLTAIVDFNKLETDGFVAEVMGIEPLADKFRAFGWRVREIDGHDFAAIEQALRESQTVKGMPSMVVAHTTKGKGVSFMENVVKWHGATPNDDELARALKELGAPVDAEEVHA